MLGCVDKTVVEVVPSESSWGKIDGGVSVQVGCRLIRLMTVMTALIVLRKAVLYTANFQD